MVERWRYVALGLLAALGVLVLIFQLLPYTASVDKDFAQEYVLARAIRAGADPYQSVHDLGAQFVTTQGYFDKPHPTPHPPTVGLLALPLGFMDYGAAARVWFVFELACLGACVLLLVRERHRAAAVGVAIAMALIAWPPITLELGLGQLMLPVLVSLVGGQAALGRNRSALGGILIGLSLLIKPIAWPWLVWLAIRREWRAVFGAGATLLVGGLASVVAIGLEQTLDYVTRVLPTMTASFQSEATNIALWTVGPRLGQAWLGPLLAVVALGGCLWWSARQDAKKGLAMMTIGSLLASPIVWDFYLTLLVLPFAQFAQWRWRLGDSVLTAGVVVLLSLSQALLTEWARSFGAVVLLLPTLGVVGLAALIARAR